MKDIFKSHFFYFIRNNFPDKVIKSDPLNKKFTYKVTYNDIYTNAKRELGDNNPVFEKVRDQNRDKTYEITFDNASKTGLYMKNGDRDSYWIYQEINKSYENRNNTVNIILYVGFGVLGLLIIGGIGNALYNNRKKDE